MSTRNNFTGKAIDRMTKETLQELFHGDLNYNYMSWEKSYLQRRFHADEYLKQISQHRLEMLETQQQNAPNPNINLDELLKQEEEHDIELQQRFERFVEIHNGEKPVLVLDVDNTMGYIRFFSEEMQIGDIVTYFASESVAKNNGKIVEIRLTLTLEISNNTLIDKIGSERMEYEYWATNNELLKRYKKKDGIFDYKLNGNGEETIGCKIEEVEVTGCKVQVNMALSDIMQNEQDIDMEDTEKTNNYEIIVIDFINENENLSKLEPMLEREGMSAVDFIYEGLLVRLRPNLDEFLEYCSEDFDVVIYTSSNKIIYEGMLQVLHEYIKEQLGREDEEDLKLWTDALYRDDCTLDYSDNGRPYYHKNLTLFGCDLSRLIMIDNSPIVCRGEEPNFILIKGYFGKDSMDDELMEVYQMLDAMIEIEGDVRYFLCGLESEQTKAIDTSTEESCWKLTEKLMNELNAYYSEQNSFDELSAGYVTEEEKSFKDDYDEDLLDGEKLTAPQSSPIKRENNNDNTTTTTKEQNILVFAEKQDTILIGESKSAKAKTGFNSIRRYEKTQSARFEKGPLEGCYPLKRSKSLLLDSGKLGSLIKRHGRYSSMSPRRIWCINFQQNKNEKHKTKLSILNINDAIHSFGAVDTDEEEEEEELRLFPKKELQHTKSSLTMDAMRYSLQKRSTKRVASLSVDSAKDRCYASESTQHSTLPFRNTGNFGNRDNNNQSHKLASLERIKPNDTEDSVSAISTISEVHQPTTANSSQIPQMSTDSCPTTQSNTVTVNKTNSLWQDKLQMNTNKDYLQSQTEEANELRIFIDSITKKQKPNVMVFKNQNITNKHIQSKQKNQTKIETPKLDKESKTRYVPKQYFCPRCKIKGEHWIMECPN